ALEAFIALRPESSALARNKFARKAGKHLGTDYNNARGLRLAGECGAACPVIVVNVYEDDTVDTEMLVKVQTSDGTVCFDSDEALGYNTFIKAAPYVSQRAAEIKKLHYNSTRDSRCGK
ncbi:MAG: hypothetical protein ACR2NF_09970, partial [Pirellulales bacterium]